MAARAVPLGVFCDPLAALSTQPFYRCGRLQNLSRPLREALSIIEMTLLAGFVCHSEQARNATS
jgi:hypothetical protein